MSPPTRPNIEALKQRVAVRRADERYDAMTPSPSEADLMANAITYIERLEQVIRAAIVHLRADYPDSALRKLEDAGVPDA